MFNDKKNIHFIEIKCVYSKFKAERNYNYNVLIWGLHNFCLLRILLNFACFLFEHILFFKSKIKVLFKYSTYPYLNNCTNLF